MQTEFHVTAKVRAAVDAADRLASWLRHPMAGALGIDVADPHIVGVRAAELLAKTIEASDAVDDNATIIMRSRQSEFEPAADECFESAHHAGINVCWRVLNSIAQAHDFDDWLLNWSVGNCQLDADAIAANLRRIAVALATAEPTDDLLLRIGEPSDKKKTTTTKWKPARPIDADDFAFRKSMDMPGTHAREGLLPVRDWLEKINKGINRESAWLAEHADQHPKQEQHASPKASDEPQQSLIREGEYWSVKYQGKSTKLSATDGMTYLAQLLQNPNRPMAAADLQHLRTTPNTTPLRNREAISDNESMNTGLQPTRQRAELRQSSEGKKKIREKLVDLAELIDTAKMSGRILEVEKLEEERDELEKELKITQPFFGHERTIADPERSTFNTVKDAIKRVIKKLEGETNLPLLAAHLAESLEYSQPDCQYRPKGTPPAWNIQA